MKGMIVKLARLIKGMRFVKRRGWKNIIRELEL